MGILFFCTRCYFIFVSHFENVIRRSEARTYDFTPELPNMHAISRSVMWKVLKPLSQHNTQRTYLHIIEDFPLVLPSSSDDGSVFSIDVAIFFDFSSFFCLSASVMAVSSDDASIYLWWNCIIPAPRSILAILHSVHTLLAIYMCKRNVKKSFFIRALFFHCFFYRLAIYIFNLNSVLTAKHLSL